MISARQESVGCNAVVLSRTAWSQSSRGFPKAETEPHQAETAERDLPEEVAFLEAYDRFVSQLQSIVDMPQQLMNLLHRFLLQSGGRLSKRARSREFAKLTDAEVERIERLFAESHARAETTDAGGSFAQSRDSSVG